MSIKDLSYTKKFERLRDWMPAIVAVVKKDLKNEHLKSDKTFWKEQLGGKALGQLGEAELAPAYLERIVGGDEELGEYVANRWILKHTDIYDFFVQALQQVNPNFDEIDELPADTSDQMIQLASAQFGAADTYLFSVFNSVVFPVEKLDALEERAKREEAQATAEAEAKEEERTIAALEKRLERELKRMEDRYEKKLAGMQKKYAKDSEVLKKQVANLQRKLNG